MAVERLDPTTNLSFEKFPHPEPPPIPGPPSEQELRVKLEEAIAALKAAEETLSPHRASMKRRTSSREVHSAIGGIRNPQCRGRRPQGHSAEV
jgi:hypothetical protein